MCRLTRHRRRLGDAGLDGEVGRASLISRTVTFGGTRRRCAALRPRVPRRPRALSTPVGWRRSPDQRHGRPSTAERLDDLRSSTRAAAGSAWSRPSAAESGRVRPSPSWRETGHSSAKIISVRGTVTGGYRVGRGAATSPSDVQRHRSPGTGDGGARRAPRRQRSRRPGGLSALSKIIRHRRRSRSPERPEVVRAGGLPRRRDLREAGTRSPRSVDRTRSPRGRWCTACADAQRHRGSGWRGGTAATGGKEWSSEVDALGRSSSGTPGGICSAGRGTPRPAPARRPGGSDPHGRRSLVQDCRPRDRPIDTGARAAPSG